MYILEKKIIASLKKWSYLLETMDIIDSSNKSDGWASIADKLMR
jgi:hypothetical protein